LKPLVLLTNDDGHAAAGLLALRAALTAAFRVVTVAPASEMSGVSHAITLARPLTVETVGDDVLSVDGTPADCVNIALHHVLDAWPRAVVSGCNHGANLGDDVAYSGTVGAAREAALFGIPALAVSRARGGPRTDYAPAAALTAALLGALLGGGMVLPPASFLNLNLPDGAPSGVSVTRLARRVYRDPIRAETLADGRRYLWVGGRPEWQSLPGTDHHALHALGHASLSLLSTDATVVLPSAPDPAHAGARVVESLRAAAAAACGGGAP
jgi:5'-nucleotidase